MAAESVQIEAYLDGLLTGDATLSGLVGSNVFSYLAPVNQALPAILMESQGAPRDVSALDGSRAVTPFLYSIKAVGRGGDMVSIQPIADRIDAMLNKLIAQTGSVQLRIKRVQPIAQALVPFGAIYYSYLGGVYRVACSPINP
jgi:hypothetical protein